jgi:hypothetical protein
VSLKDRLAVFPKEARNKAKQLPAGEEREKTVAKGSRHRSGSAGRLGKPPPEFREARVKMVIPRSNGPTWSPDEIASC